MARYRLGPDSFALTPHVRYLLPSHDYRSEGEGRDRPKSPGVPVRRVRGSRDSHDGEVYTAGATWYLDLGE